MTLKIFIDFKKSKNLWTFEFKSVIKDYYRTNASKYILLTVDLHPTPPLVIPTLITLTILITL